MITTTRNVPINSNSYEFLPLGAREYKMDYTQLPNANLSVDVREDLSMFFKVLTGKELPLEEHTFLIKSYEGTYSRLFGPVLKRGTDEIEGLDPSQVYIQWGPNFIPLQFQANKVLNQHGDEIDAEFGTFNFSGRGEDAALMVSVETESEQVTLPIAVRFFDWKTPIEPKVLNSLLKKTPEKLTELFQQATNKKSGGSSFERIEADLDFDFKELDINKPYEVIGYYPCKTSYGVSYRIFLNNFEDTEGQVACGWAHSSIRPLLATKPVISRDEPATLTVRSKEVLDNGRVRIRSSLILSHVDESPTALNLNF